MPLGPFFFNDTATTEIYTLSLHDALPILVRRRPGQVGTGKKPRCSLFASALHHHITGFVPVEYETRDMVMKCACEQRSEEHTSELQSRLHLVCRLLLEKKKKDRTCIRVSR